MDTKRCTGCGEEKSVEEFRLGGASARGTRYRAAHCKPCHAADARAYRDKNLEVVRARELAYARLHAAEKRQNARRWYAENPERGKANARRRYREKPELVVADSMVQRARKAEAPEIEKFTRDDIVRRDLGQCQICGEAVNPNLPRYDPASLNLDHIVPLGSGGSHTRENVRVTHQKCNLSRARSSVGI